MEKGSNSKRILSLVAIVATLFVVLFSSEFLSAHLDHSCNDEDNCPVCAMILVCQRSMNSIGAGVVAVAITYALVSLQEQMDSCFDYQSVQTTLVSQKVRLDS